MANTTHVSLPKAFDSGNAAEWFQRYEICCRANSWENDKMALKLPTLLEGEALAIWLELTQDEQKDYARTKKKIIYAIMPLSFVSLDDFHKRLQRPGEPLSLFVHELKQLLVHAMPDLTAAAKEQLLLHQFVTGLPHEVSKQLRAAGVKTLPEAVERAKVLMTVEQHPLAAPVAAAQPKPTELLQLQQQISELSAQVAALTTQQSVNRKSQPLGDGRPKRCFICNKLGHLQYNCPFRQDSRRSFTCGQPGHGWKNCPQGNDRGTAAWGSSRPRNQ